MQWVWNALIKKVTEHGAALCMHWQATVLAAFSSEGADVFTSLQRAPKAQLWREKTSCNMPASRGALRMSDSSKRDGDTTRPGWCLIQFRSFKLTYVAFLSIGETLVSASVYLKGNKFSRTANHKCFKMLCNGNRGKKFCFIVHGELLELLIYISYCSSCLISWNLS